ncbi:MAG: hypothetical protein ABI210_04935, partial [Abditibacteriaceae bacterium]
GLALILPGIYFLMKAFVMWIYSWFVNPNNEILKGKTYNMRNASKGICSICESKIIVDDSVTDHDFQCSVCSGNLHVDNYQVTAR